MNTYVSPKPTSPQINNPVNWKTVVRFVILGALVPLIPLLIAGRADWWQGWIYVLLTMLYAFVSRYILFRTNPTLIAERARFTESEGIKGWDKWIVLIVAIVGPLVAMTVAGLDKRYGWSPEIALALQIVAFVVFSLGYMLSTWAMVVNRFFSSVVRIQADRGQTVITSGPYQYVRHPGYTGAILSWLTLPIMLGTLWALIPAVVVALGFIIRTALEDRMLQTELPGYSDYAQHTRYRLIPGVW
jgi:protein-S-isoprenylcysteine O-methyltransferase Ste14